MRSPDVIVTLDRIPLDAPRLLIPNEVELDQQPSLGDVSVTDDLIGEAQGLINSTILDNSDLDDNDPNKLHCTCNQVAGDGVMVLCEECAIWFHCICVNYIPGEESEDYCCSNCSVITSLVL
jgi:hypothetical protein